MSQARAASDLTVGVIGGSGLYEMEGLEDIRWVKVRTPFGDPSDAYCTGRFGGRRVIFLPRHGRGHRLTPSELNYRANIYGMKKLGAQALLSISAVGSMKEDIHPLEIVVPDQFYDHTRRRISSFFGEGIVAHVGMAHPVCGGVAAALAQAGSETGARVHRGGTYICIEGPQFSTKGESEIYRRWGVSIIGMTNMPEAKLAREAEMCYATLALVTDYDVWHEEHGAVTVEAVVANLMKNVGTAKEVLRRVISRIPTSCGQGCPDALRSAVITDPKVFPPKVRKRLDFILDKYFPAARKGSGVADLVVVGSVALDSVKTPFGKVTEVLGGSATYFSYAASFFTQVRVVGAVGTDFPKEHLELLRSRGVDVTALEVLTGQKTFRWTGEYGFDLNEARTLDVQLNAFAAFKPKLGPAHRKARFLFLANIDPVLQLEVLEQMERPALIALDTMNFWIDGKRGDLLRVLSRVDVLLINDAEARMLAREPNLIKAARTISEMGPRTVVIKRGEYGALLVSSGQFFFAPAFPLEAVFDPTGAGDTFAGGFMGYLAQQDLTDPASLRRAMVRGATMASFTVEDFSLERLKRLERREIDERLLVFAEMVRLEG